MAARNPWQKLKDQAQKIRTPHQILLEQASLLDEATGGVLRADVSIKAAPHEVAMVEFSVYVPTLNNYTVRLFKVMHPVIQYPATLHGDWGGQQPLKYNSHQELEDAVIGYLETPDLQNVVASLLAQTTANRSSSSGAPTSTP